MAAKKRPPNIVLLFIDDMGWRDVGFMGSRYYETPNIDSLARQGIRFTSGYTCGPNCQPTRAALMSCAVETPVGPLPSYYLPEGGRPPPTPAGRAAGGSTTGPT